MGSLHWPCLHTGANTTPLGQAWTIHTYKYRIFHGIPLLHNWWYKWQKNGHIYYQQFYHGHTHNTYMALWYTTVEVHPYISIKITAVHLYLKPFNNTFIVQLNSFSKTRLGYTSFCPSQSQSQYTFTFLQVVFLLFCLCSYMTTSGQATWHKTGQQQLNETGQSASHTGRVKLSSGLCLEALWSY